MKNFRIAAKILEACRLNGISLQKLLNTFEKFIPLQLLIWNFSPLAFRTFYQSVLAISS